MKKLIEGAAQFHEEHEQREHVSSLAFGQKPHTLFITCSDSRLEPALFTKANPGDLFVIRNVGNIIPPSDASNDAISAALEFAIHALKVSHIVICGHSNCGAMDAVKNGAPSCCPHVEKWVKHADASGESKANVLKQMEHLKTYSFIKDVELYGWYFDLEEATVYIYDPQKKQFAQI